MSARAQTACGSDVSSGVPQRHSGHVRVAERERRCLARVFDLLSGTRPSADRLPRSANFRRRGPRHHLRFTWSSQHLDLRSCEDHGCFWGGVRLLMSRGRRWSRWWRCSSGRARSGAAARSAGCAHSTARRHLVRVGLVAAEPMPLGKPDERARFESTDPTSWNTSPKNSTPDHERRSTGQPQPSVFVIYSRRPEPLGKTHRCCEHPVNPPTGDGAPFAIDRE